MFFGLIIYMYAKDNNKHHVPHIHVEYQDNVYYESQSSKCKTGKRLYFTYMV